MEFVPLQLHIIISVQIISQTDFFTQANAQEKRLQKIKIT